MVKRILNKHGYEKTMSSTLLVDSTVWIEHHCTCFALQEIIDPAGALYKPLWVCRPAVG